MKHLKYIWVVFLCFFSSHYLTWCIDKITLETLSQKIFVFIYFLIMLGLLAILRCRYFKLPNMKLPDKAVTMLLSILIAVVTLVAGFDIFIGRYQPTNISITALGQSGQTHAEQNGTEVWVNQIIVSNEAYDLSQVTLTEGWEYREGALLSYQKQPSSIKIQLPPAESVEIFFLSHPWSGEAIVNDGRQDQRIDLFSSGAGELYNLKLNGNPKEMNFKDAVVVFACFLILCVTTFFILVWVMQTKSSLSIVVALLTLYLVISSLFKISTLMHIALILLTIACGITFSYYLNSMQVDKRPSKLYRAMLVVVTLYSTFALVGQQLFMAGDLMTFTLIDASKFMLVFIFTLPFICSVLFLLEKSSRCIGLKSKENIDIKSDIKLYYLYFSIFFSIWMIALTSFFPANMTSDSVSQWKEAQGIWQINNHHPAFHTLVIRWISYLYPSPFLVASFQVFFCAFVLSDLWVYFATKKYNRHILAALAVIVAVSPGNIMLVTTLWKDIPYTFSLIWLSGLLLRAFENANMFFQKGHMALSLVISLVFVYEFRHNGVIPFIFALVALFGLAIVKLPRYKVLATKIATCSILSILCVTFINGPIFSYYNVNTKAVEGTKYTVMLTALGAVAHNDLPLEAETIQLMESTTVSLDEYKEYYNGFNGDQYIFNIPNKSWIRSNLKTGEVIKTYLREFVKYPSVIIKDRLDGTEILWNVTQAQNSFNYKYEQGVYRPSQPLVGNSNYVAKALRLYCAIFERISLLNILFWRSGIYIVFLIILLLFCFEKKNYRSMIFLIPCLGNTVSLILSLYHQSYRYIYFLPISVILFALIVLANDNEKEKERVFK